MYVVLQSNPEVMVSKCSTVMARLWGRVEFCHDRPPSPALQGFRGLPHRVQHLRQHNHEPFGIASNGVFKQLSCLDMCL
jgi:hypothetical protein